MSAPAVLSPADARRASAEQAMTPETRARLAEWHALTAYDLARIVRYGDMAATRRSRELSRRADGLLAEGVPISAVGAFPEVAPAELAEAFRRVVLPRYRRFLGEPGVVFRTKYAKATDIAYRVAAARCGVQLDREEV